MANRWKRRWTVKSLTGFRRVVAACVGGSTVFASCASPDEAADELWSRNLEGGPVVTFSGSLADAPELKASAVATIGDADGPEWSALGRIGSGEILADGGFAITDMQARRVHVYGPDGSHRHSMGRRGNGPGEFATVNGIAEFAGGLEVWDSQQQRLTTFDSDGAFRTSTPAPDGPYLTLMERWEGSDGYFAMSFSEADRGPPVGSDFAVSLAHADIFTITESGTTKILEVPYLQAGRALRDGVPIMATVPFAYRGRTALFAEGVSVVFSGQTEVLQYDRSGGVLRRVRLPAFDAPLTDAVVDSARAAALAGATTGEHREVIETSFALAIPERMPTFDQVLADGQDLVLGLHEVWASEGLRPWLFMSPADQRAGVLRLAVGERILDAEGGRLLVAGSTPAGVPQAFLLQIENWK